NAVIQSSEVSLISGFQVITEPGAFQTLPAKAGLPFLFLPVINADLSQATIYPGSIASIYGQNLAAGAVQLTLSNVQAQNNVPVLPQFVGPQQINFFVPLGFPA